MRCTLHGAPERFALEILLRLSRYVFMVTVTASTVMLFMQTAERFSVYAPTRQPTLALATVFAAVVLEPQRA